MNNFPLQLGGLARFARAELPELFQGFEASFVLLNTSDGQSFQHNLPMCGKPLSPCSTFKVLHALIGLETGVVQDEKTCIPWDGTRYDISAWNQDQTLETAVRNSAVWYFKNVAQAVGQERMQKFIDKVNYGNRDISGGLTRFWLGSSLKISANQQVTFLKGLVEEKLPFSTRSMQIVKNLIRLQQTQIGTLYGKTGSFEDINHSLGWFVGYVEQSSTTCVFAVNIQAAKGASGIKARELTETILTNSGLL